MAMELGEVRFDRSGLPEVPLERGDALDCVQDHNCEIEYPRLIRRRARQRARRKWFRNGFQETDVALKARVARLEADNLVIHEIKNDLSTFYEQIKSEMKELTRNLHEETRQCSEMARRIADQERSVARASRRTIRMRKRVRLLSKEAQIGRAWSVTVTAQFHEKMAMVASQIKEQQQRVRKLSEECAQVREVSQSVQTRSMTARARAETTMIQKTEKMEMEVSLLAERLCQSMHQIDLRIETSARGMWTHISSNQAAIGQIQMQIQMQDVRNIVNECRDAFRDNFKFKTEAPSAGKE